MNIPLSLLDLAPVGTGFTATDALNQVTDMARLAERLGYRRFWVAEHHGMPGIASSSPEVLIAHIAAATRTIRVGAGGIMLPNHAPLRIAEAFHTLESLHPGRIDLGIGRAPGTDPATSRALRPFDPEQFPAQMQELFALSHGTFPADHPFSKVKVVPQGVALPPVWLLGSSGASARFAGELGVGYGFASHFSSTSPLPAVESYRRYFRPSAAFSKPHFILAVAAVCAPTAEEAAYHAKSMDLVSVQLYKGEAGLFPTPEEAMAYDYSETERAVAVRRRGLLYVGTPAEVRARLQQAVEQTGADELMISTMIYDPKARERSHELLAAAFAE